MPLQPQVGISFCYVRSPVNHIYLLLGELSTIAELSLATNSPENLQRRGVMHLQRDLKDKVAMMNRLQLALEHNRFFLMAQPILAYAATFIMKFCCALREMTVKPSLLIASYRSRMSLACRPASICG